MEIVKKYYIKNILSLLILVVIVTAGIHYWLLYKDEIRLITEISFPLLALVILLNFIVNILYGIQLKIVTDYYKLNLNFLQALGILVLSRLANMGLPPGIGSSFKAVYMKKKHSFSYSSFIASSGAVSILKIFIYSLFCFFMLLAVKCENVYLLVLAFFVFTSSFLFLFFMPSLALYFSFSYLKKLGKELKDFLGDKKNLLKLVIVILFIFLTTTIRFYLEFILFSVDISFMKASIVVSFTLISGLFNLIPGNMGIKEFLIVALSGITGAGINESLHVALLDRMVVTFFTIFLAPCFLYDFNKKKNNGREAESSS